MLLNSEFESSDNDSVTEDNNIVLQNCTRAGTKRELEILNAYFYLKTITSADSSYWSAPPSGASYEFYGVSYTNSLPSREDLSVIFPHPAVVGTSSETITVKIRPHGWTTDLMNADIWIEVDYLSESSGLETVTATSKGTGTTYSDDSWSDLSVTFTPGQAGMVEVRCYLSNYESGAYVLIDPDSGA